MNDLELFRLIVLGKIEKVLPEGFFRKNAAGTTQVTTQTHLGTNL